MGIVLNGLAKVVIKPFLLFEGDAGITLRKNGSFLMFSFYKSACFFDTLRRQLSAGD